MQSGKSWATQLLLNRDLKRPFSRDHSLWLVFGKLLLADLLTETPRTLQALRISDFPVMRHPPFFNALQNHVNLLLAFFEKHHRHVWMEEARVNLSAERESIT
jgi:hypothetical protein